MRILPLHPMQLNILKRCTSHCATYGCHYDLRSYMATYVSHILLDHSWWGPEDSPPLTLLRSSPIRNGIWTRIGPCWTRSPRGSSSGHRRRHHGCIAYPWRRWSGSSTPFPRYPDPPDSVSVAWTAPVWYPPASVWWTSSSSHSRQSNCPAAASCRSPRIRESSPQCACRPESFAPWCRTCWGTRSIRRRRGNDSATRLWTTSEPPANDSGWDPRADSDRTRCTRSGTIRPVCLRIPESTYSADPFGHPHRTFGTAVRHHPCSWEWVRGRWFARCRWWSYGCAECPRCWVCIQHRWSAQSCPGSWGKKKFKL